MRIRSRYISVKTPHAARSNKVLLFYTGISIATLINKPRRICESSIDTLNMYVVVSTLLNFVRLFRRAHEENGKQAELEKKKAEDKSKEVK